MKTFPYNKESDEGRRLFKLFDLQYNPGVLDVVKKTKRFETYDVASISQCRANNVSFIFPSNLAGVKRPQVRVESDVEMAWGNFADGITTLDFTHGEELPLSYTQPLDDDTLKLLIDAGLYRDSQFEPLMNKLMTDELFDAESDMRVSHLDVGSNEQQLPVLIVEPVDVIHNGHDPSEQTTLSDLVKRSARLVIKLRKQGVKTEDVVSTDAVAHEQDAELFVDAPVEDVVSQFEDAERERAADMASGIVASSELLDQEIDMTEKLKDSFSFTSMSEDDQIRELKSTSWQEEDDEELDASIPVTTVLYDEDEDESLDAYAMDDVSDLDISTMDDDREKNDDGPDL